MIMEWYDLTRSTRTEIVTGGGNPPIACMDLERVAERYLLTGAANGRIAVYDLGEAAPATAASDDAAAGDGTVRIAALSTSALAASPAKSPLASSTRGGGAGYAPVRRQARRAGRPRIRAACRRAASARRRGSWRTGRWETAP